MCLCMGIGNIGKMRLNLWTHVIEWYVQWDKAVWTRRRVRAGIVQFQVPYMTDFTRNHLCEVSRHSFPGDPFASGYLPKWLQWRWLGLRSHETRERSNAKFTEIVFHEWKLLHPHGSCAGSLMRNFTVLCSAPGHTILSETVLIFLCFPRVSWDSPILYLLLCDWILFTFGSLFDQSTMELQSL